MYDFLVLGLDSTPTDDDMIKLSDLNLLLNNLGVSFDYSETNNSNYKSLTIKYDTCKLSKNQKRNAGAPKKYLGRHIKIADIRKRMETESADLIAQELGISRATLFRKLKNAEKLNNDYIS